MCQVIIAVSMSVCKINTGTINTTENVHAVAFTERKKEKAEM